MHVRFFTTLLLVFSALTVFAQTNSTTAAASVAVPTLVRFSGTLPASNGNLGVTFSLYKDQTGGAPLWLETQTVVLDGNGRYSVNLGANHASGIPAELFAAGEARWLGVQAEGQPEQPRVLLVSVPYAMKAADADTLGGLPASAYVTAEQLSVASRQSPVTPQSSAPGNAVTPSPCAAVTSDGTALANYFTMFTTPCNIEKSGLYQSTAGFLAVGTTAPVAPLDLELPAQTGTTGSIYGEHLIASVNPAANSAANSYAFFGEASTAAGNTFNFTGDLLGSGFIVQHNGTGTVTNGFGGNYTVINHSTGTITNAASFYGLVTNQSTGTITNGYGLEIPPPQNTGGGKFTNFYGVYVSNPTGATNSWGLYTLAAKNYMSGDLGIGVTAPAQALEINGNIKIDTTGHGITYPDGTVQTTASVPGTGTITKVTAGTDLTGGGSSGAVTLNLDTTKVPTLAAATNTFTGAGGIVATHFSGDGTSVTNVNAAYLGGVAASAYPQLGMFNGFTAAQNITGMGTGYILEAINNFTGSGSSAIYATSAGSNAVGVYGEADNGSSAYGVEGLSTSGYGVVGSGALFGGKFAGTGNAGVGVYAAGGTDSTGGSGGNGGNFVGGTETNGGIAGAGVMGTGGAGTNDAFSSGGAGGSFQGGASDSTFGGVGVVSAGGSGGGTEGGGAGGQFTGGTGGTGAPNTSGGDGIDATGASDALQGNGGNGGAFTGGNSSGGNAAGIGIVAQGGVLGGFSMADAGEFIGDLDVTGAITAGTKDFKIDHPLDPANKYLYHASVESSEMKNIYDGTVTTNQDGFATVRLPDWFEAVNTDFRYQLTVIGQFAQAIVAQKISSGQFVIRTDKPSVEVSWQVTGVRQDAFAKAHPLQVEVEKLQRERGYYVHPELFGAPHEKQVVFATYPNLLNRPVPVKTHSHLPSPPLPPHHTQPVPPVERPVQKASLVETK